MTVVTWDDDRLFTAVVLGAELGSTALLVLVLFSF